MSRTNIFYYVRVDSKRFVFFPWKGHPDSRFSCFIEYFERLQVGNKRVAKITSQQTRDVEAMLVQSIVSAGFIREKIVLRLT